MTRQPLTKRQAAKHRAEMVRQRTMKRSGDRAYVDLHLDVAGRMFFSANALFGHGGRQHGPFPSRGVADLHVSLLAAEHGLEVGA